MTDLTGPWISDDGIGLFADGVDGITSASAAPYEYARDPDSLVRVTLTTKRKD